MEWMWPNFFIVGAPKAGTTALYSYLKEHPSIFLPEPAMKEPHYFSPELRHPIFVRTLSAYESLFERGAGKERRGEASVFYLFSREAPERIHDFNPDARIIIMLRDPVDMIYALHSEHFTNGIERYRSFADALAAEERRLAGAERVESGVSPELYAYRQIGAYHTQVQRYCRLFPREQIHFIFFEDFVADTAHEYRRTLEFLGVNASFQPAFPKVNENRRIRSRFVQRVLLARPRLVQKAARKLSPAWLRHGVLNFAFRYNSPLAPRPPLDPGIREHLRQHFQPEVAALAQLTGRDLTSWSGAAAIPPAPLSLSRPSSAPEPAAAGFPATLGPVTN